VAYVFEGEAAFGVNEQGQGKLIEAVHMVEFSDGDHLQVQSTPDSGVRFMLIAGAPFKEPIVPYGPFVMNTPEEIQQALLDLRNGTFVKS
jgi:redox-sensitive bicupin YhaK (pirin superfamily)